jgi:hypothetical protein
MGILNEIPSSTLCEEAFGNLINGLQDLNGFEDFFNKMEIFSKEGKICFTTFEEGKKLEEKIEALFSKDEFRHTMENVILQRKLISSDIKEGKNKSNL